MDDDGDDDDAEDTAPRRGIVARSRVPWDLVANQLADELADDIANHDANLDAHDKPDLIAQYDPNVLSNDNAVDDGNNNTHVFGDRFSHVNCYN